MIQITFPTGVDSLTAKGLTQYDTGQRIEISGTGITTETVQVHFAASGQSSAIIKPGTVVDGAITAEIPDSVLAMGRTVTAWAYVIDGDERETQYTAVLPVVNRARPQDYISPAEPPYLTANELLDRVETAETTVSALTTELTTARNGEVSLDERLDKVDLEVGDRYTKAETDAKSLKLKNLIVNGDFSQGVTGWAPSAITVSIADNAMDIVATENSGEHLVQQAKTSVELHKYYCSVRIETSDICKSRLTFHNRTADGTYEEVSSAIVGIGSSTLVSMIAKPTSIHTSPNMYFRVGIINKNSEFIFNGAGESVRIYRPIIIDLTATFGAGNEPTAPEMNKLIDLLGGWFDGEITLEEKQLAIWTLNLIRQNRNAIIALGGTII